MSSPWTDLLFLHGHVPPGHLSWREDAPADSRHTGKPPKGTPAAAPRTTAPLPMPRPLVAAGA